MQSETKQFMKTRQSSDSGVQKSMINYAKAREEKAQAKSAAKEKEKIATAKSGRRFYTNSNGDKVYIK